MYPCSWEYLRSNQWILQKLQKTPHPQKMNLSFGATDRVKSQGFMPCFASMAAESLGSIPGGKGCLYGWTVCVSVCSPLTGITKSLSLTFASDPPREKSGTLLTFVVGLYFPSLYATIRFLSFSSPLKSPGLGTPFSPCQPPAWVRRWLLQEGNQRIRRNTRPYKAFSVRREVGQWWTVGPH